MLAMLSLRTVLRQMSHMQVERTNSDHVFVLVLVFLVFHELSSLEKLKSQKLEGKIDCLLNGSVAERKNGSLDLIEVFTKV